MAINLKEIREKIIKDTTEIIAEKYNAKKEEVKVCFTGDGSIKATITPDLDFLSCTVIVEGNVNE